MIERHRPFGWVRRGGVTGGGMGGIGTGPEIIWRADGIGGQVTGGHRRTSVGVLRTRTGGACGSGPLSGGLRLTATIGDGGGGSQPIRTSVGMVCTRTGGACGDGPDGMRNERRGCGQSTTAHE
jgi:hypothetical protein